MRLRRIAVMTALVASVAVLASASPALAEPNEDNGTGTLKEQLEVASKAFVEAKNKLAASEKRQKELTEQLKTLEVNLVAGEKAVGELAGRAYRNGRLAPMSIMLSTSTEDDILDRATLIETMAVNQEKQVQNLVETKETATRAKAAIDSEVADQKKQLDAMEKRKKQAENALKAAGGGAATDVVSGTGRAATAVAVERTSGGGYPNESCTANDPTTSGCITPRTLHAYKQTKAAGFDHHVSCFRSGGSGEHPKGRACDWAAQKNGFEGTATGSDKVYGDNLAAFYIKNADRLGVLYVIWFHKIWLPSSGWKSYNGDGTPSGDHTNHVHLSMI